MATDMRLRNALGTRAALSQATCWAALSWLTGGCLVTDRAEFGEANVPAHLVRLTPADFARVPANADARCGTGSTRLWMRFGVKVSDPNVDDSLVAHIFVNGRWINRQSVQIPAGAIERPDLFMCVQRDSFDSKCNLVEILVSRAFVVSDPYQPAEPNDVARMRWWILDEASEEPNAVPQDCAEKELLDGGAPP